MKTMILITMLLVGKISFAQATTKVSVDDFKKEMKDSVFFSGEFSGELEDFNTGCTVKMVQDEKGSNLIQLDSDAGIKLSLKMDSKAKVSRHFEGDDDYVLEYKWSFMTITIVHADDAYDTVSLSSSSTKLTCGAYY
jgi:hypothetical protein